MTRGRRPEIDTSHHCCPNPDCAYRGWGASGNLRANSNPVGVPGGNCCVWSVVAIVWRPSARSWTHRRERVTRPGKLYCLFLQDFVHLLIADKFPQVPGTGSSDSHTEEKRVAQKSFSCKSASAEGK